MYFVLGKYILRVFNISLYQSLLPSMHLTSFSPPPSLSLYYLFNLWFLRLLFACINPLCVYKVCSYVWSRVYFVQEWILPSNNDVFGCRKYISHLRPKFKRSCYQISDVYKLVQLINLYQKLLTSFINSFCHFECSSLPFIDNNSYSFIVNYKKSFRRKVFWTTLSKFIE